MKNILIINGPNLNLTGSRQPDIYGRTSLDDIISALRREFGTQASITHVQSNHEGDIIDALHRAGADTSCAGVVLNAGAYTHTSLAIADAIAAIPTPVIEVHLSNTAAREPIRRTSVIAPVCRGSIAGFGALSYSLAVTALLQL